MKLVSYLELPFTTQVPDVHLGALLGEDYVVDLAVAQTWAQGTRSFAARQLPETMLDLLNRWEAEAPHIRQLLAAIPLAEVASLRGAGRKPVAHRLEDVLLLAPLPNVLSLRSFVGFEGHVRNVHRLRQEPVPRAWYEFATFRYGNPFSIAGPGQPIPVPGSGMALDFSLEIACVIGRRGRNIPPQDAYQHIAGYTILNDWTLRDVERGELRAGSSPAKSHDFATSMGPALVTPDELTDRQISNGPELRYHLTMSASVNGAEKARGNFQDIHWTIPAMVARASADVTLYPGEVIASGPVGTGTLLENRAEDTGVWLEPGDWVELTVERLGTLGTQIIEAGAA